VQHAVHLQRQPRQRCLRQQLDIVVYTRHMYVLLFTARHVAYSMSVMTYCHMSMLWTHPCRTSTAHILYRLCKISNTSTYDPTPPPSHHICTLRKKTASELICRVRSVHMSRNQFYFTRISKDNVANIRLGLAVPLIPFYLLVSTSPRPFFPSTLQLCFTSPPLSRQWHAN